MATTILKVQNVIKILIFISLLCSNSYAQTKLNGTFCIDYPLKDFSNCITFETEKTFSFKHSGDTGIFQYGQGEYKFTNNSLILNYNKTEPIKTGYHTSKVWTNNKNYININFKFFDFEGNYVPYVNIMYKDSLSENKSRGFAANNKGEALLTLNRDTEDLQFEVSNVGFNHYKFKIDKNYNYEFSIYLQKEGEGIPILNQIDTLEIVKKKTKYFTVKNKDGEIITWRKIEG